MSISWGDIDAIRRGEHDDPPANGGISWGDIDSIGDERRGEHDLASLLMEAGLAKASAQQAAVGLVDRRYVSIEDAVLAERRRDPIANKAATDDRIRKVAESCNSRQFRRNTFGRLIVEGTVRRSAWGRPRPGTSQPALLERRAPDQVRPRLLEASTAVAAGEALLSVCLISEGQGSSGRYPATTLQEAGRAKVFAKGLHCYLDHPTEAEAYERPGRSVRDLAGCLESDATYRDGGLYASVRVFADFREFIIERASAIGMSIRADGEIAEGVITKITRADSVDFVTRAGRGGRIL